MTWLATTPAAAADRALNAAIADADISRTYEEYLDIVDRFYSDGIEFARDDSSAPLVGKAQVNEEHSEWSLELVGVTGRKVTLTWSIRRTWRGGRVVHEYHYAQHRDAGRL